MLRRSVAALLLPLRAAPDAFAQTVAGGAIFRTRPTNVFLVKATHWFSP
jgi:hypothetical protein